METTIWGSGFYSVIQGYIGMMEKEMGITLL